MEHATLPDEVLFALFKLIPPFETGKYATVSKKWATIISDNELWRSYCEQRWRVLSKETDVAKNWIIPTKKQENKAIRIDWHKYYLLRAANDRQLASIKKFSEAVKVVGRKKKLVVTDFFSKTGFVDPKEVKVMTKAIHTTFGNWVDQAGDPEDDRDFLKPIVPPGSIMDIMNFMIELELHMASKATLTRVKSLKFTTVFLLEVQTCCDVLEMPNLELKLSPRLVQACKDYYKVGMQQNLDYGIVSDFYQATIELISSCRSFKQRKAQLTLLAELLELVADSLTKWKTDDTWFDWCNSKLVDDDEAQSPLFEFITALKSGATIASSKVWYSFLTNYAARHYPPENERERLTLLLLFSCEAGHIKAYLNKHRTDIITKYFAPIINGTNEEHMIAFLFVLESIAISAEAEFIDALGELALPRVIAKLEQSEGIVLLAESALIGIFNARTPEQLPNLVKFVTVPLIERLLVLLASSTKTVAVQAADALSCLFAFKPDLYSPEIEVKIGAAFQNVKPEFSQETLPFLVEIASIVQVDSLSGVAEAFNQALTSYTNTPDADPSVLLKMTQYISYAIKPSKVLMDSLPAVVPILLSVIRESIAQGMENFMGEFNDDEEEHEIQVPDQLLSMTDKRFNNKSSAFIALSYMLNNMPPDAMRPYLDDIIATIMDAVVAPGSEEIHKDLRSSLSAVAQYLFQLKPSRLEEYIQQIWHVTQNSENLYGHTDSILNHLIELEEFLAQHAPEILPSILLPTFEIIKMLIDITAIDENDSVASVNLGYGELSKMFELIIAHSPDKRELMPRIKQFFGTFYHEISSPVAEKWVIYDMISAVYEHCAEELIPEDHFGFMKNLWAARILETRYVSQTVAYTLSVLARDHPQLLPDTVEECIKWVLMWLNKPNVREENAGVYDNVLVAYAHLLNLIKDDQAWISEFKSFLKYFPPTEEGDTEEGVTVVILLADFSKRAQSIGADAELVAALKQAQLDAENYVPLK